MWRKIFLVCAFLFSMVSWTLAQDAAWEFEGRYWMPDLKAKAKIEKSNIGSDINFKSDLGIKEENFPEGRVIWNLGEDNLIRLFYTQANFKGDQTLTRSFDFNGKTYTAGTKVTSKLDLQYFGLGWIWQFLNMADEKVKLGTVLELKGIAGKASLDAQALALNESADFIAGLPTAGLALEISPFKQGKPYDNENFWKSTKLYAEASGMSAGKYGYFIDSEAGLKLVPFKYFSISGGYRYVSLKAENKPDYAKVELKGPFVGASIRF
jgi:hypothetical protein